jgi:hypothetical protein
VLAALLVFYLPHRSFSQCGTAPTSGSLSAGTGTTIINSYFPGTGNPAAGSTSLVVGTIDSRGSSTTLSNGDMVVIMQMQGVSYNSSNSIAYGDGSTGSGYLSTNVAAGNYEYNIVSSFSSNTITFSYGLAHSYYTSAGAQSYQVVRVPRFYNYTIGNGRTVSAPAWNGSTGGVVVIEAANTFTINGSINVDGLGFRGGGGKTFTNGVTAGNTNGTGSITNTDYRFNSAATTAANTTGGAKGEGIAGTPRYTLDNGATTTTSNTVEGYTNGSMGQGAPGNAGGGGTDGDPSRNQYNTGGGGGGNGGAGGKGGSGWDGGTGNAATYATGGNGGAVYAQASLQRFVMGGGGGAGTANNATTAQEYNCSGAAGGGIILIRAKSYSGSGTLSANGASALDVTTSGLTDAAGGGGAGGTIVMMTNTATASAANTITATANGGDGGDMTAYYAHGPGGGGGGGVVVTNVLAATSITVNAGAHGLTRSGSTGGPIDNNYGSASGAAGIKTILASYYGFYNTAVPTSQCGILPVTIEQWGGVYKNDKTYLSWQIASASDFAYFIVERSTNGVDFTPLSQLPATAANNASYTYTDAMPSKGVNYYRLKMVDNNGSFRYSGLITIRTNTNGFNVTVSPNPFTDHVAVTIESTADEVVHLRLFNSEGKVVWQKSKSVSAGTNVQYVNDFQLLAPGIYYMKINRTNSSAEVKLLKQ